MTAPVLKRIVVASYETTDGKTFTSKSEAQTHQRDLKRINELDALVKRGMSDGVTTVNDSVAAQIAAFLLVYADELREILPKRAASAAPIKLNEQESERFEAALVQPALSNDALNGAMDTFKGGLSGDVPLTVAGNAPLQGQLPVNPLAGVVTAAVLPTAVDPELEALMAGLDVVAA